MLIDREEFIAALTQLKPALGVKGVVPELAHVWFEKGTAQAYDGGFGIKIPFKTDLICGVPGTTLLGLLQTSALKQATLEPNGKDALQLKLGKSHSKLATLAADRKVWPFPIKLPQKTDPTELNEEFIEGLRKTLFIKASPATRVEHYGVMVHHVKNDLLLYSTDSATMVQVMVKGAGKAAGFERTLFPRDFAEQLVAQAPAGATLYTPEDCFIAEAEGISLYSNLLDISSADDIGAIVDRNLDRHPEEVPLPAGLEGALARAEILAGTQQPDIEASIEKGVLKLSGDYALGTLQESLPLEGKHPDAKIRLRAGLIRRALVHADSFSLTKESLLLCGTPGFVYLVASL
jgi:DNA polymerase III sliding clamp (beta) subunit (PCNA family)